MRKLRWFLIIVGVVFIGGIWFYFSHQNKDAVDVSKVKTSGQRGGPGGPVPVVAGVVRKQDVPIYLNGIGTVQAYNTETRTFPGRLWAIVYGAKPMATFTTTEENQRPPQVKF